MVVDLPEKLSFLFDRSRYKVVYGGREGIKSWSIAQALLLIAAGKVDGFPKRGLRILCARETQQSIRESVHQLLDEQIKRLELRDEYDVLQSSIKGRHTGAEFFFAGLRNLSVDQIKSFEGIDICWIEEAANVSKNSWQTIVPTIRKAGSEIWISFNPKFSTDETYRRFVLQPPPNARVLKTGWEDNLWLSPESRAEIEHLKSTDPDSYDHVYGGTCVSSVVGAIYKEQLTKAEKEGRFTRVPYEPTKPVDTYWDLGFGDMVSIWFAQTIGFEYRLIDYYQNHMQGIEHYTQVIQQRGYTLGTCVLPWDGGTPGLATGRSIKQMLQGKGLKVRVIPQGKVHDRLNAVRTIFHQCWFDAEKCEEGIEGLRRYQWGPLTQAGVSRREPLHDAASHPADAFGCLAVHIKTPVKPEESKPKQMPQPPRLPGHYTPFG